jgi:hypothetical protein
LSEHCTDLDERETFRANTAAVVRPTLGKDGAMPTSAFDIARAANRWIQQHGDQATEKTRAMVDEMRRGGNAAGADTDPGGEHCTTVSGRSSGVIANDENCRGMSSRALFPC